MFQRNRLSTAVLAASAVGAPAAQAAIEEVVVTATKRTESTQDIPVSVNALNGDEMTAQGTSTFLEYVQYLPNVVQSGRAPGRNDLYIRGSATEQGGTSVSSVNGTSPAVALYLDEQPVAFGGRNLDVYAADLTRVEVLPGPQGTLFGASSQAGTVRLITNKPDHTAFSAGFDTSVSTTKGGELSNSVEAFLNIPVSEALAVRIVGYNDYQGGWIDNVPGTFTPSIPTINRNQIAFGSGFRPQIDPNATLQSTTNGNLVEDDQNDATYKGARIGVSYDFNADWNLLVQHTEQQLDTEGVFDYDPHLDEESVQRYTPNENEDAFGLTTWTVEGRARGLDIIYTGGYLDREVDMTIDYTGYNNGGGYIAYYMCNNDGGGSYDTCFDPTKTYVGDTENTRVTHELRVSTPQENRWRVTAGIFVDDIETNSVGQFNYASTGDAFGITPGQVGLVTPGANVGGVQFTPDTTFVNDYTRQEDQVAVFGEVAFDIMPDLTFKAGARYYEYEVDFKGASNFAFGCKFAPGTADAPLNADGSCNGTGFTNDVTARLQALGSGDVNRIVNLQSPSGLRPAFRGTNNPQLLEDALNAGTFDISDFDSDGVLKVEDTILKFSLDYRLNEQLMVFGTFSEGFRPPGVNRNAGQAAANQTGRFQGFLVPARAETDELINYELGFKGDFLDRTLRFNATAYYSEISDLQTARFDPANVAFLVFLENVGDAEVRGIDGDFTWLPTPNLTISGAFSYIQTEITDLNPQLQGIAVPEGSELPYTPEFSGNIRARYDFDLPTLEGRGYVRAGVNYRTDSFTGITGNAFYAEQAHLEVYGVPSGLKIESEGGTFASPVPATGETFQNGRYVQEGYALVDLAAGVEKNGWTAELFMQNAFDEAGDVFITANNSADFTPKVVPTRPRTIGLRVSYDAF